jgi:hypothetical protein
MPLLGPSHITNTCADVNTRARSLLNDNSAQIWTDAALLNFVRDAYTWLYGQVIRVGGGPFERVVIDIPYTPITAGMEQDIGAVLPADLYFPEKLEFRLNTGEEYVEIGRSTRLSSRTQQQPERIPEWEFRGNTIIVIASQSPGLLKLRYGALLPLLNGSSDTIGINNAVEAIAHYAASQAFDSRGQAMNASAKMGSHDSGKGAVGFADMILDHIVLNEQEIPRRGERFGDGEGSEYYWRQHP